MKSAYQLIIIGGGPAGLAAAISAYDEGIRDLVILEREENMGGILNQCIHNGFGLRRFKESLSGPEYAARFIDEVEKRGIEVLTGTTVLSLTEDKRVTAVNSKEGLFTLEGGAVILAMGCRERSRGALNIAGSRPAGIYSAGTAQRYVNEKGYMPGKSVVILGSGDIGLIMARRMTLEGATVHAVCEIMPYSSGLRRNIVQCLDDFEIPLYLNHTIVGIEGEERVRGVYIAEVDENRRPKPDTRRYIACDTVLFSVGLIPENELTKEAGIPLSPQTRGALVYQSRETLREGIFACGNVLQVHDLVDFVSEEAELCGRYAASYIQNGKKEPDPLSVTAGEGISYVVPQCIDKNIGGHVKCFFRVKGIYENCRIVAKCGDKILAEAKRATVAPGEMETLLLKEGAIREATGTVTLSLEVL